MRSFVIACVLLLCSTAAGKQESPRAADLRLDASFAQDALEFLRTNDAAVLDRIGKSPAAAHLLRHARNFNYDVPQESPQALVSSLLIPAPKYAARAEACRQTVAFFTGPMTTDRAWLADPLRYLPDEFRFQGTLFLTFGYDIGVAFGPSASLNCAHPHFDGHPRELLYYAIHELHHVGFMAYQPPLKFSELRTCADLLRAIEYHTQLEGMAVLAAYGRRHQENALDGDPDYLALQDEPRMRRAEDQYFADYEYLHRRGAAPADQAAWAVITRMSSGERLWYRVGARMAQRLEAASGHAALVSLIKQGPASFLAAYHRLPQTPDRQGSGR